jgi:hypothetical protein
MPTFNKYQNNPGYYIRAWTSDIGNITYKIKQEGYPIVEQYGLTHGDNISWDTINSLKSMGLIYTGRSGTIGDDEFEPDPDQVSETALSTEEAEELLEVILEHRDLDSKKVEELCNILDIDPPSDRFGRFETALTEKVEFLVEIGRLPTSDTLQTSNPEEIKPIISIDDLRETTENGLLNIYVTFTAVPANSDEVQLVRHHIFVCKEDGINDWRIGTNNNETWVTKSELIRQKGWILPTIIELMKKFDIKSGPPAESLSPELSDI